ncbi:hypothetical protein HanIR_Chr01g0014491 [Helianthus annuus]|nr:hypothetical protein HanIR_Chr01g0014491 [Helianthus annuus]
MSISFSLLISFFKVCASLFILSSSSLMKRPSSSYLQLNKSTHTGRRRSNL